jgi:hypothetical protein
MIIEHVPIFTSATPKIAQTEPAAAANFGHRHGIVIIDQSTIV